MHKRGDMRKKNKPITYAAKKRLAARRVVRFCKAITRQNISDTFARIVENHIIATMPAPLMRKLVSGDWGKPQLAAMKLTVPFFAPCE